MSTQLLTTIIGLLTLLSAVSTQACSDQIKAGLPAGTVPGDRVCGACASFAVVGGLKTCGQCSMGFMPTDTDLAPLEAAQLADTELNYGYHGCKAPCYDIQASSSEAQVKCGLCRFLRVQMTTPVAGAGQLGNTYTYTKQQVDCHSCVAQVAPLPHDLLNRINTRGLAELNLGAVGCLAPLASEYVTDCVAPLQPYESFGVIWKKQCGECLQFKGNYTINGAKTRICSKCRKGRLLATDLVEKESKLTAATELNYGATSCGPTRKHSFIQETGFILLTIIIGAIIN